MKFLVHTMLFICLGVFVQAQTTHHNTQIKKYVLQTFPAEDVSTIVLNIEGQITVQVWEQTSVCVETSVIPQTANFNIIKLLAKDGYYDVKSYNTDYNLMVSNRPASKFFTYKGKRQTVCMEYKVYVPEGTQVTDISGRNLVEQTIAAK